jgi:hypothetical protein
MSREVRQCEVLLNVYDCENRTGERVTTTCYACGNAACRQCSMLTTRHIGRRTRICNDCLEDKGLPLTSDVAEGAVS